MGVSRGTILLLVFCVPFDAINGNSSDFPSHFFDYEAVPFPLTPIPPGDVCTELNRCSEMGLPVGDVECRCDSDCLYYGDCCYDRIGLFDIPGSYPSREHLRCRAIPGANGGQFHVISDCPKGTEEDIHWQCTQEPNEEEYVKVESFLPIVDRDGIWYKNIFCASCNGVARSNILNSIKMFQDCRDLCPANLELSPEHYVRLSDMSCSVALYNTDRAISVTFRRCPNPDYVVECPGDYQDMNTVDYCRHYISPVYHYDGNIYRNAHCATCNGTEFYQEEPFACFHTVTANDETLHLADVIFAWDIGGFLRTPTTAKPTYVMSEIIRLGQCEAGDMGQTFLILNIDTITHATCPYLAARVEGCTGKHLAGIDNGLQPWDQLVIFPVEEPFPSTGHQLRYRLPEALQSTEDWKTTTTGLMEYARTFAAECGFSDAEILRVCDDTLPFTDIFNCDQLFERDNSTEIVMREDSRGRRKLLDPETLEVLGIVEWFGFISRLDTDGELRTTGTRACLADIEPTTKHAVTLSPATAAMKRRYTPIQVVFSSVAISISIVCLIFTFMTYCIFGQLRNNFGLTLMSFVGCLSVAQLLTHFLIDYVTGNRVLCIASAFTAHFFWVATFAWMNLLAWNLKATFSKPALNAAKIISRKRVIGYISYGWVAPLMFVAVCGLVYGYFGHVIPVKYGLVGGETCWIGPGVAALSLVGIPLAVAISINAFLFAFVVRGIQQSKFRHGEGRQSKKQVLELLVYIKISLLMGFIWIFGFLIHLDVSGSFFYLFYTSQAAQSILIMVFFTLNDRVRSMWREKLPCLKPKESVPHRVHTQETTM